MHEFLAITASNNAAGGGGRARRLLLSGVADLEEIRERNLEAFELNAQLEVEQPPLSTATSSLATSAVARVGFRALCLRFRARPARNCPKLFLRIYIVKIILFQLKLTN